LLALGRLASFMETPHTLRVLAAGRDGLSLRLEYEVAAVRDDYYHSLVPVSSRRFAARRQYPSKSGSKIII
jgi:hypothetical protein